MEHKFKLLFFPSAFFFYEPVSSQNTLASVTFSETWIKKKFTLCKTGKLLQFLFCTFNFTPKFIAESGKLFPGWCSQFVLSKTEYSAFTFATVSPSLGFGVLISVYRVMPPSIAWSLPTAHWKLFASMLVSCSIHS